jgi:hypothetical protein
MKLLTKEDMARVEPSRLYTADEAAALLGLHANHLRREVKLRRIISTTPLVKGHAKVAITGAEVIRVIRKQMTRAQADAALRGVLANPSSQNAKLGFAATTTVARQSCPESCAFRKDGGCYAEYDNNRQVWDRISLTSQHLTPLDLAQREAEVVDAMPADRDLRLHIAGDSTTSEGTRLLAAAAGRYIARGSVLLSALALKGRQPSHQRRKNGPRRPPFVWAYTHAWREVKRADWGPISILASCETSADVALARERGYAAAVVVPEFRSPKTYVDVTGMRIIPCPAQTAKRTCTTCRLCFDDTRLRENGLVIGFAVHGQGIAKATAAVRKRVALPMAEKVATGVAFVPQAT